MSSWTYINGTITVSPIGRTQEEKEYILKTILNHLPIVTSSEDDMYVDIIMKKSGGTSSCSCDEYGCYSNNLRGSYGNHDRYGRLKTYDDYILVVSGSFRDRVFDETYKEFVKWICRLSKRVNVDDVLVEVKGYDKYSIIRNEGIKYLSDFDTKFGQMYECPSWCEQDRFDNKHWKIREAYKKFHPDEDYLKEPAWWEYLHWERMDNCEYPRLLGYKYFDDEKNDEKVLNWISHDRED